MVGSKSIRTTVLLTVSDLLICSNSPVTYKVNEEGQHSKRRDLLCISQPSYRSQISRANQCDDLHEAPEGEEYSEEHVHG